MWVFSPPRYPQAAHKGFMGRGNRLFLYLISFQMESVLLILAAWWLGEWLNEEFPQKVSWYIVTFVIAFFTIVKLFYSFVKIIMEGKNIDDEKD